jgi:ABC-type multidrug transport system fused ATPase/permease subunit
MAQLAEAPTGDLIARVMGDVEVVGIAVRETFTETWDTLLFLASFFVAMLVLAPVLTLWAVLPVPFAMLIAWASGRLIRRRVTVARQASSLLTDGLQEQISNVKAVRLLGMKQAAQAIIDRLADAQAVASIAEALPRAGLPPIYTLVMTAGIVVVFWKGGAEVIVGTWTLGVFVTYLDLFLRFTGRGFRVPQMVNAVQAGGAAFTRLAPLLAPACPATDEPSMSSFRAGKLAGSASRPPVRVESGMRQSGIAASIQSVSVCSANDQRRILNDICLEIPGGAFVAVTGPVGSGKSVFAKTLLGMTALAEGAITLDGDPPESHRSEVGYLPQDPFVFEGTVRENIVMGADASDADILCAQAIAALGADLTGSAGVASIIGASGLRVSGGQKQRIAFARACVSRPRLLVLDDPFSAVDVATEAQMISHLMAWRNREDGLSEMTIVLCSHRLAAFPNADLVVVLEEGSVVEQGTHARLVAANGLYARIHAAQVLTNQRDAGRP